MVRTKRHPVKFVWSETIKPIEGKYLNKWVEGPRGKLWVSSVYWDVGGFHCMVYGNENYKGSGLKIAIAELEDHYKVIPSPPKDEHREIKASKEVRWFPLI
jgi:hypothetical protein